MASNKNSENVCNFVKRRKRNLIKVFNSRCCLCGFNAFPEALEFHHVDPSAKSFGLTTSTTTVALEKQLKEAKKCVLLCANCHRGVHYGYLTIPNNWQDFYQGDVAQALLDELEQVKAHKINYCKKCGIEISKNAEYCVSCRKTIDRRVERPSRDELKQLIRTQPFTHIGQKYGVTDNSIRKWCVSMNLPNKKQEINKYSDQEWELI